jgi:hypothetical protein
VSGRELLRGPRYVLAMQCRPVVFLSVATLIDFPPYGNGDLLGREQASHCTALERPPRGESAAPSCGA